MISTSLQHERFMLMNGLVRWNPFREMDDLQRRMTSLFDWSPFRRSSLTTDDRNCQHERASALGLVCSLLNFVPAARSFQCPSRRLTP